MENPFSKFVQAVNPFAQFKAAPSQPQGPQEQMRARIAAAKAGTLEASPENLARAAEADQVAQDQIALSNYSPVYNTLSKVAQGFPFVGEYLDEATGAVNPAAGERLRSVQGAMDRQYPKTSIGLNIAGGVIGSAPIAVATGPSVAGFVGQGATRGATALRAAGVAIPAGALEGAASASGRAEPGKRLEAAGTGALVGGTIAGFLGAFAPIVGEGAAALAKRIKKLDVTTIANEFGLSKPAARVVKSYLMADDLDAAAAALARGGDDAMLANAGPATRQALDTAASTGGQALSVTRQRVGAAVSDASNRFLGVIDDVLGDASGGIKGAAKAISQRTSAARKAAYDFAYNQPTPMVGEAGEKLQGVLARISPDDFSAAIKEANAEMLDSGYTNQNIMASIGADGKVTFSQPLSVLQLDYIARGLGNVVEKGTDTMTGALTPAARRAQGQLRSLRDVMKESVDGYRAALRLGGDAAQQREALSMGRKLLSETTTPEDVRTFLRSATSDEAKAAIRTGLRENLEAIMGRARTTIADLENGAVDFETGQNASAEALAAIRNLLTKSNMVKTRLALGSDANKLFAELEKMADVLVLRTAVAKGSATAIRTAGREQMTEEVAPGIVRRVAGNLGNPLDAAREISREVVGIDARSLSDQERQYFAEIADALTRIRGPEAQRALQAVRDAIAGQPMKDEDAKLIGRLVSGTASVGAYQAGTQYLAPR